MSKEVIENEKVCGACVHFKYECSDGWGQCVFTHCGMSHCSDLCTADSDDRYATEEEKRHHMAVLRQLERCSLQNLEEKDQPDVEEVLDAIDFLIDYCKLY